MLVSCRVVLSLHTVCIYHYFNMCILYIYMYLFDLLFGDYIVMYVMCGPRFRCRRIYVCKHTYVCVPVGIHHSNDNNRFIFI